jgi:hypothetical protein
LTEVRERRPWNAKIPTVVTEGRSTFFNFMRPLRLLRFKIKVWISGTWLALALTREVSFSKINGGRTLLDPKETPVRSVHPAN